MYETAFYWVGVASTVLFFLIGFCVLAAWVMDAVWARFKDGKNLLDIMTAYSEWGKPPEKSDGCNKEITMTDGIHETEEVPTQQVRASGFKDGEACSPGCANHVTHPCEKCGRTMARGEYIPPGTGQLAP